MRCSSENKIKKLSWKEFIEENGFDQIKLTSPFPGHLNKGRKAFQNHQRMFEYRAEKYFHLTLLFQTIIMRHNFTQISKSYWIVDL